jgi:hypothetical protein
MPNKPDSPDEKSGHEYSRPPDLGWKDSKQSDSSDTETHQRSRKTQVLRESAYSRFFNWWNRDRVLNLLTFLIFCTTVAYTVYSHRQWLTMQRQLELSERAWLGLDGTVQLAALPQFHQEAIQGKQWTMVRMGLSYSVKNFGSSPGIGEADAFEFFPMRDNAPKPISEMQGLCRLLENTMKSGRATGFDSGSVVFPQNEIRENSGLDAWQGIPQDIKVIHRFWAIGCIVYSDAFGIHHSKFWFKSNQSDIGNLIPVLPDSDVKWSPFNGFELWDAEAD